MRVFSLELRQNLKSSLIWLIVISLILILFLAFYPSMSDSIMQEMAKATKSGLPGAFLKIFGLENFSDLTDISQYFAYCFFYVSIALCAFAINLGQKSLVKEEVNGTIEYLYSKPVTRRSMAIQKFFANLLIITGFYVILFVICLRLYSYLLKSGYQPNAYINLYNTLVGCWFSALIFFATGFFLSSWLGREFGDSSLGIGLVFISFLIGIVSKIASQVDLLIYLSPLDLFSGRQVINNQVHLLEIAVYVVLILLLFLFGIMRYRKKDFLV